ncbi:MAG: lipase family protein [Aestuariivirga sp.]
MAAAAWLAIQFIWPTHTVRYRLTIDVETPQGIKSGSSVIAVDYVRHWALLPDTAVITTEVTGEAIFVDLGDADVTFTGHSLGGGLAGLLARI